MMNRLKSALACITLVFCTQVTAECQFLAAPKQSGSHNQLFLNIGLEPEWVSTIGYLHVIGRQDSALDLHVGGSLKFAPLLNPKNAWRANFITTANSSINEHWRNVFTSNLYIAHDKNRAGSMDGFGFELRSTPAYYGKKWAKGLDVGWQYTVLTHIRQSRETKKTFDERYPAGMEEQGPQDGWYASTASRFRVGFTGVTSIGNAATIQLSGGSLFSVQKQGILLGFSHAQVPVYVDVSLRYLW